MQGSAPVEIFCSYAHADEKLFRQLEIYLQQLKRERVISLWHNRSLVPGTDWTHEIDAHLETSSIVLLLVSPNFLTSDYCDEIEMQRILQRHEARKACIIPIIVRPCDWSHAPFGHFQALPSYGKAITAQDNRDIAWRDVTKNIRQVIEMLSY
jgi:hypothetical protein